MRLAQETAASVEGQLSTILQQFHQSQALLEQTEREATGAHFQISELNSTLASMHQRSAGFKHRAEELKGQMKQLDREDPGYRHVRRTRAKVLTGLEDLEIEIEQLKATIEDSRDQVKGLEENAKNEQERLQTLVKEVDGLQESLPGPQLYVELFEMGVGKAHCDLYLDKNFGFWAEEINQFIGVIIQLHQDLQAGKYRIDTNSEFFGGRCSATAEAMFAGVAIGKQELSKEIFGLACDPEIYFHHIFDVFRCWCLGLYLTNRHQELRELLQEHQFSEGLREGYTNCFIALLNQDGRRMAIGLKDIVRHEWELWQQTGSRRAAGVVNFGAAALSVLALERGITVQLPADTIPDLILTET